MPGHINRAGPILERDSMKIGFIGAGKVGVSLGKFFSEGGWQVSGYYSRSISSAEEAAAFIGTKAYRTKAHLVRASDAVFLTVPDGSISEVYEEIQSENIDGKQICHCSGSLTAEEVFSGIRGKGAYGYSIHPLFPVSSKENSWKELSGAYFCLEGDGPHLPEWKKRLESLGPRVQMISGKDKVRYHAACVISSNLVCGLIRESMEILESCGFSENAAREALGPLVRSNTEHLIREGPVSALTGPVERCDTGTVEKHLRCFKSPEEREMYRVLSEKLTEIAAEKHPETDYTELKRVLLPEERKEMTRE